jgi:predicted transcriptional regulator
MAQPGRKPTVSDEEILRQFMLSPEPFLHPTELTEPLDMSRQGVFKRLQKLEEKGLLDSKKTAGTRNFWITDDGKSYVASGD